MNSHCFTCQNTAVVAASSARQIKKSQPPLALDLRLSGIVAVIFSMIQFALNRGRKDRLPLPKPASRASASRAGKPEKSQLRPEARAGGFKTGPRPVPPGAARVEAV